MRQTRKGGEMAGEVILSRRGVVVAAAATAAAFSIGRTRAAEAAVADFTYKFATNVPLSHPLNVRLQEAFDRIRNDSNGKVDIQLFPNNQLGGDTDVLAQLRSGAVE